MPKTRDGKIAKYKTDYSDKVCVVCNKTFTPNRVNQLVCSTKCRYKRSWEMKKEYEDFYRKKETMIFPQLLLDFVNRRNQAKFILATTGAGPGIGTIRTVSSS